MLTLMGNTLQRASKEAESLREERDGRLGVDGLEMLTGTGKAKIRCSVWFQDGCSGV